MTTTTTMSKLTDRENLQADVITELAKEGQLGLYRVQYEGKDHAVLITLTDDPDPTQVRVTPLALLIDERMFDQLIPYEDPAIGLSVTGVGRGDLIGEHPALNGKAGDDLEDWNPFVNRSAV